MHGPAVVDTGSTFTLVPEAFLRAERFPVSAGKSLSKGIRGIGGRVEARYLEDVVIALVDRDNQIHPVNLPRLFFVEAEIPIIFGREAMTLFNSRLNMDFVEKTGSLDVG